LKCLHVPSQESERSCIRVLGVSILPLSTTLIFDIFIVPTVWYFFIVPTVWYFFIVLTVWYFFIVPTVWYFFIVPTVWYFFIVPTVWYFLVFHFIYALKNKLFCMSKEKETYKCLHMSFIKGQKSTTKSNFP